MCIFLVFIDVHLDSIFLLSSPSPTRQPTPSTRPGRISLSSCQPAVNAQSGLAARLFCCLAVLDNNTKVG